MLMLNNKDFDFRRADYLVIDLMWKSTEQTTPRRIRRPRYVLLPSCNIAGFR